MADLVNDSSEHEGNNFSDSHPVEKKESLDPNTLNVDGRRAIIHDRLSLLTACPLRSH